MKHNIASRVYSNRCIEDSRFERTIYYSEWCNVVTTPLSPMTAVFFEFYFTGSRTYSFSGLSARSENNKISSMAEHEVDDPAFVERKTR